MREQILSMLKNTEDYLSGQELCEKFSVSRTAVWKVIHSLQKDGYEIEAVRNRGYRLVASPDILLSEEVKSRLTTEWWGREIRYFKKTDSTNNEIRRCAEEGAGAGLVAIAEEQTAGKGRRGRTWISRPNENIYLSFLLKPELDPAKASMITLVTALAAADAIEKVTGLPTGIKWPNDIVVHKKKVVGILTEMSTELTAIQYIIVGIGFNVNQTEFPEELKASGTSLKLEKGENISRSQLVAKLGHYFEIYYKNFLEHGDLSGLTEHYNEKLVSRGSEVMLIQGDSQVTRICEAVNEKGELVVHDETGRTETVCFGEVSVRGLYGYV